MLRLFLAALALTLGALPASAQILNTLSGFEHGQGWQGEASAFVRLSGGNTELQNYLAGLAGQWEGERNRVRLIGSYDFAKTEGTQNRDDLKLHLRHNYHLSARVSSLAFAQYQRNPFQDLKARDLLGAGLRFNLHEDGKRRVGFGVSAMYEIEELTDGTTSEAGRLSTFLDFRRDLKEYLHLAIVGWYQPRFGDFTDARSSALADLDVDLAGPLKLVLSASWEYDSTPPPGIEKVDWSLRTGVRASI
jgi:hypothetical protein